VERLLAAAVLELSMTFLLELLELMDLAVVAVVVKMEAHQMRLVKVATVW
jgi:hypothetical protein